MGVTYLWDGYSDGVRVLHRKYMQPGMESIFDLDTDRIRLGHVEQIAMTYKLRSLGSWNVTKSAFVGNLKLERCGLKILLIIA